MSYLERIFADKRMEVAAAERDTPLEAVARAAEDAAAPPDILAAIRNRRPGSLAVVAEIKRRSPSRGTLNGDLDPVRMARVYRDFGAAAISVLTDNHYFGGSLDELRLVVSAAHLPVLRKDFIFSPYQVYEAKAAGASAVLLIAGMLGDDELETLIGLTRDCGLAALVEVHTRNEVDRSLAAGAGLIGINNRDLHSFEVRLETTLELRPLVPAGIPVIAESGIRTGEDAANLLAEGVDGILVGEALVRAPDPGRLLAELAGVR